MPQTYENSGHFLFDRLVPELAHRFETMRTDDQEIIRIPARPDNDRLQRRFV
jgi:hypothetical protein